MAYLPQQINRHFQPLGEDEGRGKNPAVSPRHLGTVDAFLTLAGGKNEIPEPQKEADGGGRLPRKVRADVVVHQQWLPGTGSCQSKSAYFHHVSKMVTGTVRLCRVRRYFSSIFSATSSETSRPSR